MAKRATSQDKAKVKGNLTQIRPGVWKYRRYMGTVDGREIIKSKTFEASTSEEAALLAADHARAMMADKVDRLAKAELVRGLVDDWWEQQQQTASPATLYRIRPIVDRIRQRLGPIALSDLNARHVEQFYGWLRTTPFKPSHQPDSTARHLSESTVHHHHRILSAILRTGERWGRVDVVATRRAQPPKRARNRVRPPSPAEIGDVISYARTAWPNEAWFVMFTMLAKTGCRRGELCALRWGDLRDGVLWVERSIVKNGDRLVDKSTKTGEPRLVELDLPAQDALELWYRFIAEKAGRTLGPKTRIFPDLAADPKGMSPVDPDRLSGAWRRACDKVGVSARLHDLRHWHATQLLHGGVAVQSVAKRLGHAQSSTTLNIYAHAIDDRSTSALIAAAIAIPEKEQDA